VNADHRRYLEAIATSDDPAVRPGIASGRSSFYTLTIPTMIGELTRRC
jgi:hypothetical protein